MNQLLDYFVDHVWWLFALGTAVVVITTAAINEGCVAVHPSHSRPEFTDTVRGHVYGFYRIARNGQSWWELRHDSTCTASHIAMYHNDKLYLDSLFEHATTTKQ